MSTSPPQSPVNEIQIDTPPPSPTSFNVDLHDTPGTRAAEVVDVTPSRRQKQLRIPLRNKRQRVASLELPNEISDSQVHPMDDPFFNSEWTLSGTSTGGLCRLLSNHKYYFCGSRLGYEGKRGHRKHPWFTFHAGPVAECLSSRGGTIFNGSR